MDIIKLMIWKEEEKIYRECTPPLSQLEISGDATGSVVYVDDPAFPCKVSVELRGARHKVRLGRMKTISSDLSMNSAPLRIQLLSDDCSLWLGDELFVSDVSIRLCAPFARVSVGNGVRISPGVRIIATEKNIPGGSSRKFQRPDIFIGNHCWLGCGAFVLANSYLPDNSVVGAQSVVYDSFQKANTVLAGNPARVIKENIDFMDSWS